VVTSYTAAVYTAFSYTIGAASTSTPYPTFTQVPACNYVPSKTVTVNTIAFPGTNLNGGGPMSGIFGDNTGSKIFTIVDTIVNDGTNVYTFAFTSTLPTTPVVSCLSTFTVTLVNPCLTTVISDNATPMSNALAGTELQSSPSSCSTIPFP
jgi:hypothetical protein